MPSTPILPYRAHRTDEQRQQNISNSSNNNRNTVPATPFPSSAAGSASQDVLARRTRQDDRTERQNTQDECSAIVIETNEPRRSTQLGQTSSILAPSAGMSHSSQMPAGPSSQGSDVSVDSAIQGRHFQPYMQAQLSQRSLQQLPLQSTSDSSASFSDPLNVRSFLPCPQPSMLDLSQEVLLAEVKRLRERIVTLESRNASMSLKLSQQQWEVEHRLSEIEMQICGSDSMSGSEERTATGSATGGKT